jgi:SH3 domain protein
MQPKTNPYSPGCTALAALLLSLALLLSGGSPVAAETWYVKPSTEVPIRAGQGQDFKILAVVPDGMAVELLEEAQPWSRVRTPGGTEGWMLKRYLSSEQTPARSLAAIQEEKARLAGESSEISRKFNELSQANAQNLQQLESCRKERDEIRASLETLRRDSADVMGIKQGLTVKSGELQEAQERLAAVEAQLRVQKRNNGVLWFLAGAMVLLCGWFLGSLSTKNRKRKTTLY